MVTEIRENNKRFATKTSVINIYSVLSPHIDIIVNILDMSREREAFDLLEKAFDEWFENEEVSDIPVGDYLKMCLDEVRIDHEMYFKNATNEEDARNKPVENITIEGNNSYAVVSYWVGEDGATELWPYGTEEEAKKAITRLWEQSYNLALEDESFDEDNSYHEDDFAVIAWENEIYRYFEVVKQNNEEVIL